MKFKTVFSSVIILVGAILLSFSSKAQEGTTTLDPRISEVYRDNMKLLSDVRVEALTRLLNERVEIREEAYSRDEKYQLLSEVPLFNKYNTALTRDEVFNINTFNVLKYNLAFFENRDALYRVDNTNFVIIIHQKAYRR
ncbi:hypothetical protein HX004_05185 [Myroides sp. 1354]|uniref:hypothetical protein n=1 Tax=unclassified Myroides TaxID=2642485 RepID=UPI00257608FD|nr:MULTISPECIES: hypothetical protein [unclassified Myroides]MDM1044231.1 hypothetical protein [Myroides sp. R163-1]MDM1055167.1 hypothetical protein [Myroides sp. 1354]MDM1068464.1 hypothetical protein [Myroides sp. 1372]